MKSKSHPIAAYLNAAEADRRLMWMEDCPRPEWVSGTSIEVDELGLFVSANVAVPLRVGTTDLPGIKLMLAWANTTYRRSAFCSGGVKNTQSEKNWMTIKESVR